MTDIQALIARKEKEIKSKKAQFLKTSKPATGKNKYRILPAWREANEFEKENELPAPFFHDFGMHYVKKPGQQKPLAVYVCADKTFGRTCEICDAIDDAMIEHSQDPKLAEALKGSRSRQSYIVNALHLNAEGDSKDEPIMLEVGPKIFEQICEFIKEYGDITDPEDGLDIIINREGKGLDTTYTVLPAAKSKPVKASVLAKMHDLDAAVAQENESREKRALEALGKVTGVLPSSAPKTIAPSSGMSKSDAEISDAEFEEFDGDDDELDGVMSSSEAETAEEADEDLMSELDDELDSLLDDVG